MNIKSFGPKCRNDKQYKSLDSEDKRKIKSYRNNMSTKRRKGKS